MNLQEVLLSGTPSPWGNAWLHTGGRSPTVRKTCATMSFIYPSIYLVFLFSASSLLRLLFHSYSPLFLSLSSLFAHSSCPVLPPLHPPPHPLPHRLLSLPISSSSHFLLTIILCLPPRFTCFASSSVMPSIFSYPTSSSPFLPSLFFLYLTLSSSSSWFPSRHLTRFARSPLFPVFVLS